MAASQGDPDPLTENLKQDLFALDFSAGKSIRYHAYRRSFWKAWEHWTKVLSVGASTAVVVTVFNKSPEAANYLAVIVATLSTADIVFGFSDKTHKHDNLYREWCDFQVRILAISNPTAVDIIKLRTRRVKIESEETGVINWLEQRCYEEECRARGKIPSNGKWMNPWKVWLSQWAVWPTHAG